MNQTFAFTKVSSFDKFINKDTSGASVDFLRVTPYL